MNSFVIFLSSVAGFLFFAALLGFVFFRGTALLQFYQQEEYDTDRFLRWVLQHKAFDTKASLIVLFGFLLWGLFREYNPPLWSLIFYGAVFTGLGVGMLVSRNATKGAKKPLVQTARVQRIFYTYLVYVGIYFSGILMLFDEGNIPAFGIAFLLFFQFPPFFICAANFILKPIEERINAHYLKLAKQKMAGLSPTIIAITGSYGKTSIKHILAHILSATAPTLATPGSVNTPMGVVRIIRELLKKNHKYFIVEMGAYGQGSIAGLCKIAPPDLGIISAVGLAHFERFKSVETVFKAKFELAEALKQKGGKVIVNTAAIDHEMLDEYQKTNPSLVLCEGTADNALNSYTQTRNGLDISLQIVWKGKVQDLDVEVPLYGPHQATNILLATVAALQLGISPGVIKAALRTMPQVSHRLEVSRRQGGLTVIDDAYNSNPTGFSSALDLLETLKTPEGRAILLTPGMVELGTEHDAQHRKLGAKTAGIADIVLAVGAFRMEAFIEAFNQAKGGDRAFYIFKTQGEAESWLVRNARSEDVVLIENNLPDIYEAEVAF